MIQLLGIRTYFKDGKEHRYDAFFDKNWRVDSISELFGNIDKYIEMIPEGDRYNMFYTVANCTDKKREFKEQSVLPIDIDYIEEGTEDKIVKVVLKELGISPYDVGIVYSGHGVHILIGMANPIKTVHEMESMKPYYKALAGRINQAIFNEGLQGSTDTTAFSRGRILRLPNTINMKPNVPAVKCRLVNSKIVPLEVDIYKLSALPKVDVEDQIHPRAFARFPKPDSEAVLKGCSFIAHCRDSEDPLPEPMWYAMLSIVGRLENGEELCQNFSMPKGNKHPNYDEGATSLKIKHALEASGPRTCNNISDMHEGCRTCPHFGKITSPIQIVGESTIRTEDTGFYNVVLKDGVPKVGKPNYDDLMKRFAKDHEYVTLIGTRQVLIWTGTHWEEISPPEIHHYAESKFDPTPSNGMCLEFESKLKRTNLRRDDFTIVEGKLNFSNGVLDLRTGEMVDHSTDFGFTYVIPFDYTPTGSDSNVFQKFLFDVSLGDQSLIKLIKEYMGYCMSGEDPSKVQKCAILYGEGSNGKSVLLALLRALVGERNYTSIGISSLKKENYRYAMMNKLFNASDETPTDGFLESSIFKAMVAGDEVEVRRLYQDPMMWKCTTKLIFNCNTLPSMSDFSFGMKRRLLIIPFRASFTDKLGNKDPDLLEKLLVDRSDILRECIEAYLSVKNNKYRFTEAKVVEEEIEDYDNISDVVLRFVHGTCVMDKRIGSPLSLELIYKVFVTWCSENSVKPLSYANFTKRFSRRVSEVMPDVEKTRPRALNGNRIIAYKFLKLVTHEEMSATF